MSRIVQKHHRTRFSHSSCHCKTVSKSCCLKVTKGAGLTDRSIASLYLTKEKSQNCMKKVRFLSYNRIARKKSELQDKLAFARKKSEFRSFY